MLVKIVAQLPIAAVLAFLNHYVSCNTQSPSRTRRIRYHVAKPFPPSSAGFSVSCIAE